MSIVSRFQADGLETHCVTSQPDEERGGTAVVLLHGWGASGDDLLGLARALARADSRFFVPAAPLALVDGGRAWWHLEPGDRPSWAWAGRSPVGYEPHPDVTAARLAVQELLATVRERYAPDRVVVAGFSQGAMLALDVGLRPESGVNRVAAMSGLMVADSLTALTAPRPPDADRPRFLVAHGDDDQQVPFEMGELARDLLADHGFDVLWQPFEGGHSIPAETVVALRRFVFEGL